MAVNYNIPVTLAIEQTTTNLVSCQKCTGACCREGMILELSDKERDDLVAAGTEMSKWRDAEYKRRFGREVLVRPAAYLFESDCGNLDQEKFVCKVYGQPERPDICSAVPVGGVTCLGAQEFRIMSGKDVRAEQRPDKTD